MPDKNITSFLHDSDARRDFKMLKLRRLGGWEYVGLFWGLIEVLREQPSLTLSSDDLEACAYEFQVDDDVLRKLIRHCIDINLFSALDDGSITSPSLRRRIEAFEAAKEKKKEAGAKGGLNKALAEASKPLAVLQQKSSSARKNPGSAIAKASLRETNKYINNKLNNKIKIRKGESEGGTKIDPSPPPVEEKTYQTFLMNVKLTHDEHSRLRAEFGSEVVEFFIAELDDYLAKPGKSNAYSDHNRAIRNWIRRAKVEGKGPFSQGKFQSEYQRKKSDIQKLYEHYKQEEEQNQANQEASAL